MKQVNLNCEFCKKDFKREEKEYKRNKKKGMNFFCSLSCSAKFNKNIPKEYTGNYSLIKGYNKKDEFSPFRYHLIKSKSRDKNNDLSLEYLKSLWDKQSGTCVYSGIKLTDRDYRGNNGISTASLDRIDSNYGYIKGNVQFVSMNLNFMKHKSSHNETIELCKIITNFWKNL